MAASSKEQLLQRLAGHGVVGAGGAGFPTHVKLAAEADTIILNAAECEPLLHKDKELLRHFPAGVLDGHRVPDAPSVQYTRAEDDPLRKVEGHSIRIKTRKRWCGPFITKW